MIEHLGTTSILSAFFALVCIWCEFTVTTAAVVAFWRDSGFTSTIQRLNCQWRWHSHFIGQFWWRRRNFALRNFTGKIFFISFILTFVKNVCEIKKNQNWNINIRGNKWKASFIKLPKRPIKWDILLFYLLRETDRKQIWKKWIRFWKNLNFWQFNDLCVR